MVIIHGWRSINCGVNKASRSKKESKAALELGELGYDEALEPLITMLKKDENHAVKRDCAEGLGLLGDKKAVDALIFSMMNDEFHYTFRNEAAEALGKLKDKKAIPYLIKFMQNDEWDA